MGPGDCGSSTSESASEHSHKPSHGDRQVASHIEIGAPGCVCMSWAVITQNDKLIEPKF